MMILYVYYLYLNDNYVDNNRLNRLDDFVNSIQLKRKVDFYFGKNNKRTKHVICINQ